MIDFIYKQADWYNTRAQRLNEIRAQFNLPKPKVSKLKGLNMMFEQVAESMRNFGNAINRAFTGQYESQFEISQRYLQKLRSVLETLEIKYHWSDLERFTRETKYKFRETRHAYPGDEACYELLIFLVHRGLKEMPVILTFARICINNEILIADTAAAMAHSHTFNFCRSLRY